MKKTFSIISIIFVFAFSYAQDTEVETKKAAFKIGANLGFSTAEYNLNTGIDIAYLRKINEKLYVGATTGYSAIIYIAFANSGEDFIHFFPLAASAHYSFHKKYFVGLNGGVGHYRHYTPYTTKYGMGYLFEAKLGYQRRITEYYVGYKKMIISDNNYDLSPGYFNLGVNFKIL